MLRFGFLVDGSKKVLYFCWKMKIVINNKRRGSQINLGLYLLVEHLSWLFIKHRAVPRVEGESSNRWNGDRAHFSLNQSRMKRWRAVITVSTSILAEWTRVTVGLIARGGRFYPSRNWLKIFVLAGMAFGNFAFGSIAGESPWLLLGQPFHRSVPTVD